MAERGQSENPRSVEQDNQRSDSPTIAGRNESGDLFSTERNEKPERKSTANRGFAAMHPEKQKRIASEGGRAAHRQGVAHEWSKDEAREAGKKGGQIVSQDRDHMSEIGRKGGQSSGLRRGQQTSNNNPQ